MITIPREGDAGGAFPSPLQGRERVLAHGDAGLPNPQFVQHFAPGGAVCPFEGFSIADHPGAPGMPEGCLFEWGAATVRAREALLNLLEQSSTTMTWQLLCRPSAQPQDQFCVLNVAPLIVTAPRADGSPRKHYLLYDRCATCPPPGRHLAPIEP